MWGTNLDGDYSTLECGYIQSPTIDLSSVPTAGPSTPASALRLLFRNWMHVENRFDAGIVQASTDGVSWQRIVPLGGYNAIPFTTARSCLGLGPTDTAYTTPSTPVPAADAWKVSEFDLTPFAGGQVQFRWVFASDSSVVKRGWYVDDVLVQVGAGASAFVDIPAPPTEAGVAFTPAHTVYAEDFEASDGGWAGTGTGAWEWGEPVGPPLPTSGSLNLWGTRLLTDYLPNECATLTSPAIALPAAGSPAGELAMLDMKVWRHLENGLDGAIVQASADGGAWETITPTAGYDRTLSSSVTRTCLGIGTTQTAWSGPSTAPGAEEWLSRQFDVTRFLGKSVAFRVVFGSDGDTERRGVYIDDVLVQLGVGAKASSNPADACGSAPGWTASGSNSSWCYGVPTSGPASAAPVWATNLAGLHNASECSSITSSPINTATVPGLGTLTLGFQHFMDTASTDDGGVVQVSADDGATWTTVTPVGGYNSSLGTSARGCIAPGATTQPGFSGAATGSAYQFREARLTAFQGATIRVRFVFGAGSTTHDLGWYVRSVGLSRGAGTVPMLP